MDLEPASCANFILQKTCNILDKKVILHIFDNCK